MLIFARRFFGFFLVPRGFRHFRREEENKRRSIFSEGDRTSSNSANRQRRTSATNLEFTIQRNKSKDRKTSLALHFSQAKRATEKLKRVREMFRVIFVTLCAVG